MKISVDLYTLAQRFGDFKAIEMAKEAGFMPRFVRNLKTDCSWNIE